jgi:hypothetical protein
MKKRNWIVKDLKSNKYRQRTIPNKKKNPPEDIKKSLEDFYSEVNDD